VASAESYLRAKFCVDPSNRLATVHQRYRQNRQTTVRHDRANRFTNGRPKIGSTPDPAGELTTLLKTLIERGGDTPPPYPAIFYAFDVSPCEVKACSLSYAIHI